MVNFSTAFRDLELRKKLLVSYAFVFILSISIGGFISYKYAVGVIEKNVEERLENSTRSITKLVKTAATVSIRNYLRGLIEKNIESLHSISDSTSNIDNRQHAVYSLQNQKIGKNGFVYCIDQEGQLVFIPSRFSNSNRYSSLPIHITRQEGYFEYIESDYHHHMNRPKADYSKKFEPWGWIIVVSAYREELNDLININDFKYIVLSQQFGKTGHSYIMDSKGNLIIHHSKQGFNIIEQQDEKKQFYIKKICDLKSGHITYHSKNTTSNQVKESLVVFRHLPEFDWIVASETYLEEYYEPLVSIRMLIIITVFALIILLLPITYWLSASITNPVNELMNRLEIGIKGDLTVRTNIHSHDEIGLLARYFNSFMDKLETSNWNLKKQMIERSKLEREILEISEKERYRIGQDLHDDLGPHLIGIEALCKVLSKKLADKNLTESSHAETIRSLIDESIFKTRNLSKGLCPVFLGEEALESSLSDLANHTKEVLGIDCEFVRTGNSVHIDQSRASNLFNIARESIQNAVKHSQATQITLRLDTSGSRISLIIEDNGIGFRESTGSQGVGLDIMKYRANVIGGSLEIVSILNHGTKINCNIEPKLT